MGIIKTACVRVALLPPCISLIMLVVMSVYSASSPAHDPGLSMVEIDLTVNPHPVHITYSVKDIQQLVQLDTDFQEGVSELEFAEAYNELHQFISTAVTFSAGKHQIQAVTTDIRMDNSQAIHFLIQLPVITQTEFSVASNMLNRLALGHRQFVSVTTAQEIVSSRILSAREPVFKLNLPEPNWFAVLQNFVVEGVWHIWIGFDHILFVVTLLLPAVLVLKQDKWQPRADFKQAFLHTVKVISAFTIAHSLTLALTVFNVIALPGNAVESVIAASVIVAAGNNIFLWIKGRVWLLALIFGLIHGMGFASVLQSLGMPGQIKGLALIGFNLGVELGQIAIITALLPVLHFFRKHSFYKPAVIQSGSWVILLIASGWLFERAVY